MILSKPGLYVGMALKFDRFDFAYLFKTNVEDLNLHIADLCADQMCFGDVVYFNIKLKLDARSECQLKGHYIHVAAYLDFPIVSQDQFNSFCEGITWLKLPEGE